MTMQGERDVAYLKQEIRAILPRLRRVAAGGQVNAGAFDGVLGASHGGTGSKYGPVWLAALFVNDSGGDLNDGDVVVLEAGARQVSVTTSAGDLLVLGAVKGTGPFANEEETPVEVLGYHAAVVVEGAVVAGNYLQASGTAGTAEDAGASPASGAFGLALTAFAGPGAGTVEAWLFPVITGGSTGGGDDVFTIAMASAL